MHGDMMHQSQEADRSNWELSKENIQPLSSGRKISMLCHSLDKTEEAEVLKQQRHLEEEIGMYEGNDPLEPWLKYITFLEQSCTSGGKGNSTHETAIHNCVKKFMMDERYMNDKRFVDIYYKALQQLDPGKRVQLLQGLLDKGLGSKISRMYMIIADDLEAADNTAAASSILKRGIASGAQPIEYLHDALANLETRVAQRLCKSMMDNSDTDNMKRNFGSNVPVCKMTSEAQSIRVALSPGNPCRAKPVERRTERKQLALYTGDENTAENENPNSVPVMALPSKQAELKKKEQENYTKPKKWVNQNLNPSLLVGTEPREPIQIYVEEPPVQPVQPVKRQDVTKGVLAERKISKEEAKPIPTPASVGKSMYRKSQLALPSGRQITFEHLRTKKYLRDLGLRSVKELQNMVPRKSQQHTPTQTVENSTLQAKDSAAAHAPLAFISDNISSKLTEEILALKANLTEKENEIQALRQRDTERTHQVQLQQSNLLAAENAYSDLQQACNLMEQKFKQELSELKSLFRQEKVELLNKIHVLESELYTLKDTNQALMKSIEAEAKRASDLANENEELRNGRLSAQSESFEASRRVQEEDSRRPKPFGGGSFKVPALTNVNVPLRSSGALGFQLYESQIGIEDQTSEPVYDNSPTPPNLVQQFCVGSENAVPIFANQPSTGTAILSMDLPLQDENKENIRQALNFHAKPIRHHEGILVPSTSAEPMEMVFNEEEDEEGERVVQRQSDTGGDFNVTDLTRALEFCPAPLENSTPEKQKNGYLPIPIFQAAKKRKPFGQVDMYGGACDVRTDGREPTKDSRTNMEEEDQFQTNRIMNNTNPIFYGNSIAPALSPIAEASKERWSSCTSSSSSTNTTHTRGGGTFSVGSSYSSNTKSSIWRTQTPQYSSKGNSTSDSRQGSRPDILNNSE